MLKKTLLFSVLLSSLNFALGQGSQLPKYTVATLPGASTQPHYIVQVIDGASSTDCATGGGAQNVACVNVAGVWHALGSVSPTFTGTVTAGAGLLGILNGGRVFADQYCATGTFDQTCINNAFAALPNGGTIVLKPGQIYNVNACTADGDNSWLGGVIINGINGIHVEAYGAKIVLNVNTNNCRAVDIANVQGFKWDGGVITTNYQGVGTLMAIHGGGLHENEVNNTVLGTLQETTWGLPQKSANIGLDNGGTDNGQGIDVQVFTGLRFHGNNQDLIQRGAYMTDQVYIGVKRYDNGITAAATAFEITNGGATFIKPFCGVDSGNAVGSTCFKLDAGALDVEIYDFYAEISEDVIPWLIDSSTYFGARFHEGLISDYSSAGTSGSPILWSDLSGNQSNLGSGGYTLFDGMKFSPQGGGYKAIKLVDSTFGVTMKNMALPPNITLTNSYLGTNTGWNGDLNGAYATASASGWYLWKPATVQGYQGPAAGYVQTAPAPSGAGYLYQNGSGTYSWASPSAIPIRSGTWSISAATSIPVTFSPVMSVTPTSCSVMPTASSATTGQPFPTTLATTGFTVNVPTSGTIAGTYQCVVNNAN